MLKALETAAAVSALPADTILFEGGERGVFFSGVRAIVIDGIEHLLFYAQQPAAGGEIEYVMVAPRLAAPEMRAAACLTHAVMEIAKGPVAIDRPTN
jgi:hypothetical protein